MAAKSRMSGLLCGCGKGAAPGEPAKREPVKDGEPGALPPTSAALKEDLNGFKSEGFKSDGYKSEEVADEGAMEQPQPARIGRTKTLVFGRGEFKDFVIELEEEQDEATFELTQTNIWRTLSTAPVRHLVEGVETVAEDEEEDDEAVKAQLSDVVTEIEMTKVQTARECVKSYKSRKLPMPELTEVLGSWVLDRIEGPMDDFLRDAGLGRITIAAIRAANYGIGKVFDNITRADDEFHVEMKNPMGSMAYKLRMDATEQECDDPTGNGKMFLTPYWEEGNKVIAMVGTQKGKPIPKTRRYIEGDMLCMEQTSAAGLCIKRWSRRV